MNLASVPMKNAVLPQRHRLTRNCCSSNFRDIFPLGTSEVAVRGQTAPHGKPIAVNVCVYHSEAHLRGLWSQMEQDDATETVILVLGKRLNCNLLSLVQCCKLTRRLLLVPSPGHWPGCDSFGDLVLARDRLNWSSIELCRDLSTPHSLSYFAIEDGTLVFLPDD